MLTLRTPTHRALSVAAATVPLAILIGARYMPRVPLPTEDAVERVLISCCHVFALLCPAEALKTGAPLWAGLAYGLGAGAPLALYYAPRFAAWRQL